MDLLSFDISPSRVAEDNAEMQYKDYYKYYRFHLLELAIPRFKWTGLPDYIPAHLVERVLISNGSGVLFKDNEIGTQFMQALPSGNIDMNGVPKFITPQPMVGDVKNQFKPLRVGEECALIINNFGMSSDMWIIDFYAKQLAQIRQTQHINLMAQRTTQIIGVDKKSENSFKQMHSMMNSGSQVIFTDKQFDPSKLGVYNITAPYIVDRVQEQMTILWNEALTALGINNNAVVKRERVVVDEVNANNQEIAQNAELRLMFREQGAKIFNDITGENIQVERWYHDEVRVTSEGHRENINFELGGV